MTWLRSPYQELRKASAGRHSLIGCPAKQSRLRRRLPNDVRLERVSTFRVAIDPSDENGLRLPSQVMADKPASILRERVGRVIGRLSPPDMGRVDVALAFVLGLAVDSARSE